LASPIPAAQPSTPAPNAPTPRRRCGRSATQPRRGGDGHGQSRPPSRLTCSEWWARAAAKQSPRPPTTPQEGVPGWAAHQP
jgi:hypothetical protein